MIMFVLTPYLEVEKLYRIKSSVRSDFYKSVIKQRPLNLEEFIQVTGQVSHVGIFPGIRLDKKPKNCSLRSRFSILADTLVKLCWFNSLTKAFFS